MGRKKYQMWGFSYINCAGMNALTGNQEEYDGEVEIPCFNGFAGFSRGGKFYILTYPRLERLTASQREDVEAYCGYEPESGEYGVVCGALGDCKEVSKDEFIGMASQYQMPVKDWKKLDGCRFMYIDKEGNVLKEE